MVCFPYYITPYTFESVFLSGEIKREGWQERLQWLSKVDILTQWFSFNWLIAHSLTVYQIDWWMVCSIVLCQFFSFLFSKTLHWILFPFGIPLTFVLNQEYLRLILVDKEGLSSQIYVIYTINTCSHICIDTANSVCWMSYR